MAKTQSIFIKRILIIVAFLIATISANPCFSLIASPYPYNSKNNSIRNSPNSLVGSSEYYVILITIYGILCNNPDTYVISPKPLKGILSVSFDNLGSMSGQVKVRGMRGGKC